MALSFPVVPMKGVPGTLPPRGACDPRLFELCIVTCEALVSFAARVAGRPSPN